MGCIRLRCLATTVIVLAAWVTTSKGPASASSAAAAPLIGCGETVTRSAVLTRDIGPCPGDGIIVGADGITLNLNGHRVTGPPGPDDNVGIRLPQRSGVVVKGGTVADFGAGVAIMGGSRNVLARVTTRDNVGLIDGSGNWGDGIAIVNSSENLVADSLVRHNGPFDGIGVFGTPSTGNTIVGNAVELNNFARFAPQLQLMLNLDDGINLGAGLGGGSHTRVIGNRIRRNGLNGIDACSIRGNPCITTDDVIIGNTVDGNGYGDPLNPDPDDSGDGIHIVGITPPGMSFDDFFPPTRETVADNIVTDNAGSGIAVGSSNNTIRRNRVLGNGSALADFFFDLQDISLNNDCDSNVWFGNTYTTADPACTTAGGHQVRGRGRSSAPTTSAPTARRRPASPAGPSLQRRLL